MKSYPNLRCTVAALALAVVTTVLGADEQINFHTFHFQEDARIARSPSGHTVYVWDSAASGGARMRVYDTAGFPVAEEGFLDLVDVLDRPDVTVHNDGSFVAVWEHTGDSMTWGQRFTAAGIHEGPRFAINTTTGFHRNPAVARRPGNGFVVTWEGREGGDWTTFIRVFDALAQPLTPQLSIGTTGIDGSQGKPQVAVDNQGRFLIVWRRLENEIFQIVGQ